MVEGKDNKLKFIWKVENFSYCWHKRGVFLKSPNFVVDIFDGCECCLKLYPRGPRSNENYVSISLERLTTSKGPVRIAIDLEIAFLDVNSTMKCKRKKKTSYFRKGNGYGFHMMTRKEILGENRQILLPNDILTIQCCIIPKSAKLKNCIEIMARTYIEIARFNFSWEIDEFSRLYRFNKKQDIVSNGIKNSLVLEMCNRQCIVTGALHCDKALKVAHCKMCVLDSNNSLSRVLINDFLDIYANNKTPHSPHSVRFPLIHRREIIRNESLYLLNDKLILPCELIFCHGFQRSHIEEIACNTQLTTDPLRKINLISEIDWASEKALSFKNDFHKLYREETASDFTIKVGSQKFQVHKAILCARCPVFKAMLSSNMMETVEHTMEISDLEVDTAQRMFTYIYTNFSGVFDWETAYKLYNAADKYDLKTMKRICSQVMEKTLCETNVGNTLKLAHRHTDDDLKKSVLDQFFSVMTRWKLCVRRNGSLS